MVTVKRSKLFSGFIASSSRDSSSKFQECIVSDDICNVDMAVITYQLITKLAQILVKPMFAILQQGGVKADSQDRCRFGYSLLLVCKVKTVYISKLNGGSKN